MARNAKSRKLRNKKMRGGELGWWCKITGRCTDAEQAEQAQAKAAAQTAEINDYSKYNFSNKKLGVTSDPVPSHATPQGDGSSGPMSKGQEGQEEQMRKSAADMLEAKGVSSSGKFRGGKSNRRRNKKSKKSRRTRRR